MDKSQKREIFELIADDRIGDAVEKLQDALPVDHPEYMRIILLARRVRELERQSENATIALDEASLARNKISESLLGVLQDLRTQAPIPPPPPPSSPAEPQPISAPPPPPAPAAEIVRKPGEEGFYGNIEYGGAPCMKEQTITLERDYGAAFATSLSALAASGAVVEWEDRAAGRIEAKIAGNMLTSFGEKALIWLTPIGTNRTRIHVVVDAALPTMVFDWGRCKNKLAAILSHLR